MLKTAQEMLEMGFKFSPLTLGPRHDLPISHQALKKFLLHEHAWPSWKLAEVGRRGWGGVGVSVSLFWAGWRKHGNQKQKWTEGKRSC